MPCDGRASAILALLVVGDVDQSASISNAMSKDYPFCEPHFFVVLLRFSFRRHFKMSKSAAICHRKSLTIYGSISGGVEPSGLNGALWFIVVHFSTGIHIVF